MRSIRLSTRCALLFAALLAANCGIAAELPSPLLLVLDRVKNNLQFVDPVAKKVIGQLPTGNTPHEVVVTPDGKTAFVSVPNDANILMVDVPSQKELRRINIGAKSRLHGIIFAGGKLYFTAEGFQLIGRYDPASDKMDWFFGVGEKKTHLLMLNKALDTIYTSNVDSNTVTIIEDVPKETRRWKTTIVPVGKNPEGIAMSPDGKEVWSTSWGDSGLSIIDVATKKVVQTLNTNSKIVNRLAFTPDGKYVLMTDHDKGGEFLVWDAAARKEIKRLKVGAEEPENLMIVPDGSRAYIGGMDVAIFDLKKLEVVGHIPTGASAAMAWIQRE